MKSLKEEKKKLLASLTALSLVIGGYNLYSNSKEGNDLSKNNSNYIKPINEDELLLSEENIGFEIDSTYEFTANDKLILKTPWYFIEESDPYCNRMIIEYNFIGISQDEYFELVNNFTIEKCNELLKINSINFDYNSEGTGLNFDGDIFTYIKSNQYFHATLSEEETNYFYNNVVNEPNYFVIESEISKTKVK